VIGIGRLLSDTNLTPEQAQYVQMINSSGHLLLTIINDILDFSKIEAGLLSLNFAPHNVADVLESACMLCYDLAMRKSLTLSWHVDPSLPPWLLLDSAHLQQILLNLLSNGEWRNAQRVAGWEFGRDHQAHCPCALCFCVCV